jgi:hypothetical protein
MKDNSRNRRLLYIREKNRIRTGKQKVFGSFKILKELIDIESLVTNYIEETALITIEKTLKKWKAKVYLSDVVICQNQDDFYKNIKTIRLSFKRAVTNSPNTSIYPSLHT